MDGIRRLADRLAQRTVEQKPHKAPHTMSVNHQTYRLLWAYCRRKELIIGDVVSDLMQLLVEELVKNGDLTSEDQDAANQTEKAKEEREVKKDRVKKVG